MDPLERLFQEFHTKLLVLRDEAREGASITAVQKSLLDLFQDQVMPNEARYAAAHYAMATFADEFFIEMNWPGAQEWRGSLLEEKLFKSHKGGKLLFERIEEIIVSKSDLEMARLYLKIVGLGFKGGYKRDPAYLHSVKSRLFTVLYKSPAVFQLDEEMYAVKEECRLLDESVPPSLTLPLLLSSLYLLVSCAVWLHCTSPLRKALAGVRR